MSTSVAILILLLLVICLYIIYRVLLDNGWYHYIGNNIDSNLDITIPKCKTDQEPKQPPKSKNKIVKCIEVEYPECPPCPACPPPQPCAPCPVCPPCPKQCCPPCPAPKPCPKCSNHNNDKKSKETNNTEHKCCRQIRGPCGCEMKDMIRKFKIDSV